MNQVRNPQRQQAGFTIVELMIVVLVIGVLATLAFPNFVKARTRAQVGTCINNLKKMEGAKAQWAFENRKYNDDIPAPDDLSPYTNLQHNQVPTCPADGVYRLRRVSKQPTCSHYTDGHLLYELSSDDDPNVD